ncbi:MULTISPECIES: NAD(P)/FAD-dependent oxidoreductase [Nocardiaceae]|jgi:NADPH-dependent 2,4-dienoyl-CoA reductase/sulfur reductase-like enzyme|uniref:NAD(P)/FAD-dependent oxidoreductase n=1 Tax=Nocardiaceae TaxID=85025 RepID=UPI0015C66FE5|nr:MULTISPECIES: FAD-dependent oxidoreductase [Rhodococcus]MBY4226888.1 FAD-dependent oxidoreductase [Rhodococcus fascians]MBY4382358.1 FAD-dependent oxidoreductase [Rhodococcus fascians]MBY4395456.1 FAD-dependent oxidoreductase [Rhodococcus fascians]MBY4404488.1 FAD-dependent oxidoreductase [Rhodococcus fascians]MBY4408323.1 FAD-dependent oxidoreductase [Rhodococcus fascians]
MKSVTIVGASLAGLCSARALRAAGFDGSVTIVGAESHRPYDRPPLSKEYLAGDVDVSTLALEPDDENLDATWILGRTATALDPSRRTVTLDDGAELTSDGVVLATGSRARSLPGTDHLAGVHVLRTIDDADRLRADLTPGARLVVIGAGFIGAEVASTARKLGLDVTVVEAAPSPLAGPLGARLGSAVGNLHRDNGTTLICGIAVDGLTGTDRVTGVRLADGRLLDADVVVVGIGGIPNIDWLGTSGLALGNGILCDGGGATAVPGVVAVGDCAAWLDSTGVHRRVEHWAGASERPTVAVATLLSGSYGGQHVKPPYFWSDQYGSRIQFAGTAGPDSECTIEEGSPELGSFLAVYRSDGLPVGVLGVNQVRLFTRWRRQLSAPARAV